MKKLIIPALIGIVLFLNPFDLFAKTICWTDGFSFLVLSGGKPKLKPFAGKFVSPALGCHGTLTGSIMLTGPGIQTVSIEGNLPSPCVNFALYGTTSDPALNFSGVFDNTEDGISDGTATMTIVNCGTVPINPLADGPADESPLPSKPSAGVPQK
jgi:hypothetical protein